MAKNAGVDFDSWVEDAVAEYAEDLGVDPEELTERERLEAIEERVDRVAREPEASTPRAPVEEAQRPRGRSRETESYVPRRESPQAHDSRRREPKPDEDFDASPRRPARRRTEAERPAPRPRSRLDEAIEQIEARAERQEARAVRALETVSTLVEARDNDRDRLELAIQDIEKRSERNESRTAHALESLAGLVEGHSGERSRLEQAVREVESRAERNEERTAQALQSLHGLVESRSSEGERLQAAIAEVETRAERRASRTAQALESLTGLVEARKAERDKLETALERVGKRAEASEARAARALESLSALTQPSPLPSPPSSDAVASRFDELARRAVRAPEPAAEPTIAATPAPGDDDETFRLVSERLARRRTQRPLAPPAAELPHERLSPRAARRGDGPDIGAAVGDMQREMRRLADRVETLSSLPLQSVEKAPTASADGELQREMRRLADRVEALSAPQRNPAQENDAAADKAAVARIESQIGALVERIERLSVGAPGAADIAVVAKALADTRAEFARNLAPATLQAVERRLEDLAGRIEAAARRPAADPRPLEDVGRRIESLRATLERQAGRPEAAAMSAALGALNDKLDRASAAGTQSTATLSALQGAISRVEAGLQRPTSVSLDARPIEELARRVDGVRGMVERQGGLAPKVEQLSAAVGELTQKFERAAASAAEIERLEAALGQMGRQVEAALSRSASFDPQPVEELGRRIDAVRKAVESNRELTPQVARLETALAEIRARLDRPADSPQIEAVDAALRQLAAKVDLAVNRPAPPAPDPRPMEDLARRIDSVRGVAERGFAPHAARLEASLGEINAKLDRPTPAPQFDAALRDLASKLDKAVSRAATVAHDPKPMEDLARRIDSVKGVAERGFAPHAARFEAALGEIHAKLDRPTPGPEFDAALRELAAKLDEAVRRPAATIALDPGPIEELARRIESVRESLDRPQTLTPQAERLETALGAVADRLDRAQPMIDAQGINSALAAMNTRLEEAFRRPSAYEIDREPIDALAARVEAVRETVERQAGQIDDVGRPIDALARRVEFLSETVERQSEQLDSGRLAETFRNAVERLDRPSLKTADVATLIGAVEALAEKVGAGASSPDLGRLEALLEDAISRLDRPDEIAVIAEAVAVLGAKIERVGGARESLLGDTLGGSATAADLDRVEARLEDAIGRLDRPGDIAAIAQAVAALGAKMERTGAGATIADLDRIETRLEDAISRLDRPGDAQAIVQAVAALGAKLERAGASAADLERVETRLVEAISRADRPDDISAIAQAVAALGAKIERAGGGARDSLLADIVRDIALRLDALDEKLDAAASPRVAAAIDGDWTQLELAVRQLTDRMSELRAPDNRVVEQDLRALHDKLDDLAEQGASGGLIGRAADAISRDLGQRFAAANPEALIGHLQDIHQRLDILASSRPALSNFEETMRELTEELDAFRSARDAVSRGATTLSEMRAEQLQIDRRMDARFTGVQDVLEKLVDRIGQSPGGPGPGAPVRDAAPPRAAPAPSTLANARAALLEIPDRIGEPRPAADSVVETAPIAAQARAREMAEGGGVKSAAINTHIAAARRAANAAAADADRREELDSARKAAKQGGTVGGRAQALFNQHQRPILLGAAGVMTLLAGVAFVELRGHPQVRKSELDAPAVTASPLADTLPAAPAASAANDAMLNAIDSAPVGAIADPKVISAPLPPDVAVAKPSPDLVASLPAGVGGALAAAAARGDAGAEVEIAQRYLEGRTVPRDPKAAAGWMQAAADSGNGFALYRLGALYEKGVGVARDITRAKQLYEKSADMGNARAMHNLAVLYAQDGGAGKPDYATAIKWFVKAGNEGVRDSQFNLGVLYGRGLGAAQDLAASWMWFSIAAKQGDTDAARKRDEVANRMDGRAMAAAQKMLDDAKLKTPDPAVNDPPPPPAEAAAEDKAKGASKS